MSVSVSVLYKYLVFNGKKKMFSKKVLLYRKPMSIELGGVVIENVAPSGSSIDAVATTRVTGSCGRAHPPLVHTRRVSNWSDIDPSFLQKGKITASKLRHLFRKLDVNKDRSLSHDELRSGLLESAFAVCSPFAS